MVRLRRKPCPGGPGWRGRPGRGGEAVRMPVARRPASGHLPSRRVWGQRPGQPHAACTGPATGRVPPRPLPGEAPTSPATPRGGSMDIVIRGKNVEVSESLRSAALKQMTKLDRFANGFGRAEVDFSEERNPRIADNQVCEVLVHLRGHYLKARAAASEPFAALALVIDKVEHQVKRLKEKRVARTHPRRGRVEFALEVGGEEPEEAG